MAEGAALEKRYTVTPYRGFESRPLRHNDSGANGNNAASQKRLCRQKVSDSGNKALYSVRTIKDLTEIRGEVPEWPIGYAWKAYVPARGPWVRIPLSPPFSSLCNLFPCQRGNVKYENAYLNS